MSALLVAPATASGFEPLDDFGATGIAAGQLAGASGIGIDGNGRISIAEQAGARVSQFNKDGDFIHAFGWDVIPGGPAGVFEVCTTATTCGPGSAGAGPGQLAAPWDVGATALGDAHFVTDAAIHRIGAFSDGPAFLGGWGYDVVPGGTAGLETCTTACQAALAGNAAGQMASPSGVAATPSGNVRAADLSGRLHEYGPDGSFVSSSGFPGAGAGQLGAPYAIAVNASGQIAVADSGLSRVSIYDASVDFVRAFGAGVIPGGGAGPEVCTVATGCQAGASGPGAGEIGNPGGIAYSPDGNLYVTELANARVSEFTPEGAFVRAFGWDVIPGGGAGFEICTTATGCKAGVSGNGFGQFSAARDVAVDCRGSVFVSDLGLNRVTKFGEPGTRLAPCPSNAFTIGEPKLNKKKGTAKIPVNVPGPGELILAGKNVKGATYAPTVAGDVVTKIQAKGKAKKKLKKKGKAKVKPQFTFMPPNGDPNTQGTSVKLKRKP